MQCLNAANARLLLKRELYHDHVMWISTPPTETAQRLGETFHALCRWQDQRSRTRYSDGIRKDGSVFHADVTHNEIELDVVGVARVGFFRESRERKRAEEALRQSHDEIQGNLRWHGGWAASS